MHGGPISPRWRRSAGGASTSRPTCCAACSRRIHDRCRRCCASATSTSTPGGCRRRAGASSARSKQHEGDAAALYGLGRAAQTERDWPAARDFFERALAAQPEASIVHYALGQTFRELGQEDEARRHLALAGPDPVRFHDDAVRGVEALATGSGAHLLAGGRALAIGDYDTAIAEHRLAVQANPESLEATLGLAFSHLRAGAAAEGSGAAGHADQAKAALRSAVRLAPDRAYVHYTAGANLASLGELAEAESELRRALELDQRYLEARFSLGRVLAVRGRHQDAVRELTAVLELDPRTVDARFARGESLARLGREAEALDDLRAALAVDPARTDVQMWVADALARARSWDQAIAHYDAVLELEPARREAWMKKATALFIAGRYADAAATLERASAQLPDDRLLATATARFLASCPDRELRDGKRALALAEQLFAGEESSGERRAGGDGARRGGRLERGGGVAGAGARRGTAFGRWPPRRDARPQSGALPRRSGLLRGLSDATAPSSAPTSFARRAW